MHIPTGMMDGAVCPVTAAVAVTGILAAAWGAGKSDEKPEALRFASVSALIFAAQMVNFPISGGTSGHLLGGVLASALLGIPFGVLAISLALAIQTLLFSDGGVAVLGANVVNMAMIGAGLGGLIAGRVHGRSPLALARLGFAAWISVPLAAMACSMELALGGVIPFSASAPAMLGTHAVIGLGEALITLVAFSIFALPATGSRKGVPAPALAAVLIALVLAPFASSFPDGLESVAARFGFLHSSAPAFVAPLADYSLSASMPALLSTALAGLAGVLVVFAVGGFLSMAWNAPRLRRIS